MKFLNALFILVFCIPILFFPGRLVKSALYFGILSLLIGLAGYFWPLMMPKNFLSANPWAINSILHPQLSALIGAVCLQFGFGILLMLGCRSLYTYFRTK